MALEVLHNQANTHENEQFRRVVRIMDSVFDRLGYSGLLIGNPSNNLYSRFRADAILLYDHGAVIIDFKDYSGGLSFRTETRNSRIPNGMQRALPTEKPSR